MAEIGMTAAELKETLEDAQKIARLYDKGYMHIRLSTTVPADDEMEEGEIVAVVES